MEFITLKLDDGVVQPTSLLFHGYQSVDGSVESSQVFGPQGMRAIPERIMRGLFTWGLGKSLEIDGAKYRMGVDQSHESG